MAISQAQAQALRCVILDVDGVLTAGAIAYDDADREMKAFHARDGHAIKLARSRGLDVGVCSGRKGGAVVRRTTELGCSPRLLGVSDKLAVLGAWLAEHGLEWSAVAMVGDDLPDLACLRAAGFSIAVADAAPRLRREADHVTRLPGGSGAVAEILTELLRLRGALGSPDDGLVLHG